MHLCIADIAIFVYSIIIAMFVSVLFLGSGICGEPKNIAVFVASIRPGSEARKDERLSYECRIKMESQNLACKRFWLFFLFCKNANDSEK